MNELRVVKEARHQRRLALLEFFCYVLVVTILVLMLV